MVMRGTIRGQILAAILLGFCGRVAVAQPGAPSSDQAPAEARASQAPAGRGAEAKSGTSRDRLFYALPNFLTLENSASVPPLSAGEKFRVTTRSSFDPVEFFWYGALSGISQMENSEPGYGQGAAGYGKRYGAYAADGTIENYLTAAVLPSLLHQDPRYFQRGSGRFFRRTGYAVSRILITRGDSGRPEFNASEIFGSAASAGIATFTYHPRGDRNLANAVSVWGSQLGYDGLTFVVREFWPDLRRKLKKSKPGQAP